jgi:pyruvate/2-oxoglutarate/acetoin dehydrogenase E1 component
MKRILNYSQAILEATRLEMMRDQSVIVMGQGVDIPNGVYGTTDRLVDEFGNERVFDTPLSEDGTTGIAIGAAYAGLRPIHTHIRMDFLLLAMNQLINMAAKTSYMYGGVVSVPLVIRAIIGKSWGQGPQHSQSLYPLLMNIPGIKVVAPTTPYDAKGCLINSIRDNNPIVFIEHRHLYYQKGFVPEESYITPIGQGRVLKKGKDITLIGISQMAIECLRASKLLEEVGINAEVIDPVSLNPLDIETIEASVSKTQKVIIVDDSWIMCGAGSEIITQLYERNVKMSFARMGFSFTPCPTTPSLEKYFYPNSKSIALKVYNFLNPLTESWVPSTEIEIEEIEFKGPF